MYIFSTGLPIYILCPHSNYPGEYMRSLKKDNYGFAAAVGAVLSILVVILVGLLVYYKVAGSLNGLPAAGVTAAAGVNNTANTVFSLAPIIAIVVIAGIILAVVMGFGKGAGGV